MKFLGAVLLIVGSCLLVSGQTVAAYCPQQVAVIENKVALQEVEQIIRKIYKDLHCDTRFKHMPAKRGVLAFNNMVVDGELVRLQAIESLYTRKVVRSDPLVPVVLGLWGRKNSADKVLGHVRGIAWQDARLDDFRQAGWRTRPFYKHEQMYAAYLRGLVAHFLSVDILKVEFFTRHAQDLAIQKEIMLAPQSYHFLGVEYHEFMRDFNRYIRNNDPFKDLKK